MRGAVAIFAAALGGSRVARVARTYNDRESKTLTGRTEIIWDADQTAFVGGARLVTFQIAQIIESINAKPLHWRFVEYSPANPKDEKTTKWK